MANRPQLVIPLNIAGMEGTHAERPDMNGTLILLNLKTIFLVVDGVARGYGDTELFKRVHGYTRKKQIHINYVSSKSVWVWVKTRFEGVASMSWIKVGDPMSSDAKIISNKKGTMFWFENDIVRGVPSPAIMEKYQFNWDCGRLYNYSNKHVDSIKHGENLA